MGLREYRRKRDFRDSPEPRGSPPRGQEGGRRRQDGRRSRQAGEIWEIDGHRVPVSNLSKGLWPDEGHTKGDVLRYYQDMAGLVLPFFRGRPLSLYRCPDGLAGECFYQKEAPDPLPEWVRTRPLPSESREKGETNYVVGGGAASLVYVANLGCIEQNPWSSRLEHVEQPDLLLFDLDPSGVAFGDLRGAALLMRDLLGELGLEAFVKTSGGKGLHLMVPLRPDLDYEQARAFARAVAELARQPEPKLFTVSPRKAARKGKIFIDYLRNAPGATMASAYSLRPRPGATVSTPLDWEEVSRSFQPGDYHLKNVKRRLGRKKDPLAEFWASPQNLRQAIAAYES